MGIFSKSRKPQNQINDIKQEEVEKIRLLRSEHILSEEGKKTIEQILHTLEAIKSAINNILVHEKGLLGKSDESESLLEGHRDWLSKKNASLNQISSPLFNEVNEEGHYLKQMSVTASNLLRAMRDVEIQVGFDKGMAKLRYGKKVFNQLLKLKSEEDIQYKQLKVNAKIVKVMHEYFRKADVRMILYYLEKYENNEPLALNQPPITGLSEVLKIIDGDMWGNSLIKSFERIKELIEKLESYLNMETREERQALQLEKEISKELSDIQEGRS